MIELDGFGPHVDRWQDDHDRHNAVEIANWDSLRFTWRDVTERPYYVAFTLAEKLGILPLRWTAVRPT